MIVASRVSGAHAGGSRQLPQCTHELWNGTGHVNDYCMTQRVGGGVTDTTLLPVPTDAANLSTGSYQRLADQFVPVPARWWDAELDRAGVPGGPLQMSWQGNTQGLTRTDLWRVGAGAADDGEVALRLLWHALAWGAGRYLRQCRKRVEAVAADVNRAQEILQSTARLASVDPEGAYETLHRNGRGRIRSLGPAFGTKYLYFAGGGAPSHPSLILDRRVATSLHKRGWRSLHPGGGWPTATYGRYCTLLLRWAHELSSTRQHQTRGDELEHWLFTVGGTATS